MSPFVDLVIHLLNKLVEILILRNWEFSEEALKKLVVLSSLRLETLEQSRDDDNQLVLRQLLDLGDEHIVWVELL